jgi:hypothetical protein
MLPVLETILSEFGRRASSFDQTPGDMLKTRPPDRSPLRRLVSDPGETEVKAQPRREEEPVYAVTTYAVLDGGAMVCRPCVASMTWRFHPSVPHRSRSRWPRRSTDEPGTAACRRVHPFVDWPHPNDQDSAITKLLPGLLRVTPGCMCLHDFSIMRRPDGGVLERVDWIARRTGMRPLTDRRGIAPASPWRSG